jgi:uncharacterized phiE125 gp8 family phage protein
MSLYLVTPPSAEPLTLVTAKAHLRLTATDDDTLINTVLIPAVRERAELATRRQLITATWALKLDAFPGGWLAGAVGRRAWWGLDPSQGYFLDVPKPPLQSITSITYVDTAGATQTWGSSNYLVDAPTGPRCARGRIAPVYGVVWPFTQAQINALTVLFPCGYGNDETAVPALLKAAMLMDLGTLYEHRESVLADSRAAAIEIPTSSAAIYRGHRSYAQQR